MGCPLELFRRFIISSTCQSYIPEDLLDNNAVFPERATELGAIYVEANDKVTVDKIEEIEFVNAEDIIGVVYNSKSGSTKLHWERTTGSAGKLTGEASFHSLVNMVEIGIIRESDLSQQKRRR